MFSRLDVCVSALSRGDLSVMMSVVARSAHSNEHAVTLLSRLGKGFCTKKDVCWYC